MRGWIGCGMEEAERTRTAQGKGWEQELEVGDFRTGFCVCLHWGKNKPGNQQKAWEFIFFFPPIPSGLKVQDEIHSVSCHFISLTLFLQLMLGKHIKNLVGRKSRE